MFNSLGAVREPLKRHSHGCQTKKNLNESLKYYEISFHCIRGGKNFTEIKEYRNERTEVTYLPTYLFVLQVMTSKPSQHTMSDPHRHSNLLFNAIQMAFCWRADPGPLFMFSFDVSFDIMRKSTIIFSDKHFWCSKKSSR